MTPSTGKLPLRVQRTLMDLDSFEDVTLVKQGEFTPVTTAQEAIDRVGGDTAKFLEIINTGLKNEAQNNLRTNDSVKWHEFEDDGKTVGPEYNGTPADPALVNPLVLNLAKSACGYLQAKNAEEKAASKKKAIDMIKSFPPMLEGIKEQARTAAKTTPAEE